MLKLYLDYVGGLIKLKVELDPGVWGHGSQAPVEGLEYDQLHALDLLVGAGPVRDVDEFRELGRVDLLNLGCYEETGDAWKPKQVNYSGSRLM